MKKRERIEELKALRREVDTLRAEVENLRALISSLQVFGPTSLPPSPPVWTPEDNVLYCTKAEGDNKDD